MPVLRAVLEHPRPIAVQITVPEEEDTAGGAVFQYPPIAVAIVVAVSPAVSTVRQAHR